MVMSHEHSSRLHPSSIPMPPKSSNSRRRKTSTSSQRSVSPSPTFKATLSFYESKLKPKNVQNITRNVIRRLEGLGAKGHIDLADVDDSESSGEELEVEVALRDATGKDTDRGRVHLTPVKKIDFEIPRKVFHSSIGFFTLALWLSPTTSARHITTVLWAAFALIFPADIIRLRNARFERLYERCVGFLMRESEKKSTNGTIWYILGVNFALTFYPLDIATVAILILSWADTAASTIGRLYGSRTPRLPARIPLCPPIPIPAWTGSLFRSILRSPSSSNSALYIQPHIPFAPRKSLAGFLAACLAGACIAIGFWAWVGPMRGTSGVSSLPSDLSWTWSTGGGWPALLLVSLVAGLVSGVAEALDLGSLDDNLTLPIIAGGCLLAFFRMMGWVR